MTKQHQIIIIGGGHNGLVCAAYLARKGKDVLVLESAEHAGGMASMREFSPGFMASDGAQFASQLQPQIIKDLKLEAHGLKYADKNLATIALGGNGNFLRWQNQRLEGDVGEKDRRAMQQFYPFTQRCAELLQKYYNKRPPLLKDGSRQDKLTLAQLGWDLRKLGRDDMRDFLRVIAINVYDWLNEHFESDLLKGALAANALFGTHLGARSPNSVLTYLHRMTGAISAQQGAIGLCASDLGEVFSKAATAAGATVRTGAHVQQVLVENGRVAGVELSNGEQLRASVIVSNVDPKTTVMKLVGARNFETGFVRRINNVRMRGNAGKLHLALSGLPDADALSASDWGERLMIAPSMDYVERAFNPAKYGKWSEQPIIEFSVPTAKNSGQAPAGQHVLSATIQYMPYHLKAGWSDTSNEQYKQIVIDLLESYLPGLKSHILAGEFLSPVDIEQRYHLHGGHWHHGELTLDQFLFTRPVVGAPQYELPLTGLYLCGAGAHPGGGVAGCAGKNAAMAVLSEGV